VGRPRDRAWATARPWQPFQITATIRPDPRPPAAGELLCASRSNTASSETTSHGPPVWRPSSGASSRGRKYSWSPRQGAGSRSRRMGARSSPKRAVAGMRSRGKSCDWSKDREVRS